MIRIVRHFATRLKRATLFARSSSARPVLQDSAIPASAWERFEGWLEFEPYSDLSAAREFEFTMEHARVTVVLIGQAGEEVVSRIAQARAGRRLANDAGARFALAFASERGNAATRIAASTELTALA
jgi:hypothetical protein